MLKPELSLDIEKQKNRKIKHCSLLISGRRIQIDQINEGLMLLQRLSIPLMK